MVIGDGESGNLGLVHDDLNLAFVRQDNPVSVARSRRFCAAEMASDLPLIYSPTHASTITRHSDSFVTNLFHKNERLGEMVLSPQTLDDYWAQVYGNELRITSFSTSSERCLPLLVLHTIAPGVAFKLAPPDGHQASDLSALQALYLACLHESKTAVASINGGLQLHLVAMLPSQKQILEGRTEACFWGFVVVEGMYDSCLAMLNLRCLAMVLDLDETLIVANTSKTFDDRIEALNRRLVNREDPVLAATLKRFLEDKAILEQYIKTDQVFDNGKLYKAQSEVVPPVADGAIPLIRPIVRLPERNVILTRINPAVRDTSVLVRLRPNWEELKVYLLAKGRKRFEAFICTMSERDYALEMWRLLDPDARLINPRELNERVTCVKSDAKKALKDCFPRHCCHPKMAMVIDDRLPVWEKTDQPRVHEVQAFMPYTDPKAETMKELPPLCIARNIACNVRGYFFKELDETLTQQMMEVKFDTEIHTLPKAPDVSSYIVPEVMQEEIMPSFASNGVRDFGDGMANAEVEMGLKTQGTNGLAHTRSFSMDDDLRSALKQPVQQPLQQQQPPPPHLLVPDSTGRPRPQFIGDASNVDPSMYVPGDGVTYPSSTESMLYPPGIPRRHLGPVPTRLPEGTIQGSPGREEGEVPETDIDPDTRRRLLILQHGMDASKPAAPTAPLQVQIPPVVAPGGGWLGIEEEMSPRRPSRRSPELVLEPESPSFDRSAPPGFENPFIREQQLIREAARRQRNEEEGFFVEGRSQLEASTFSDEEGATNSFVRGDSREPFNASRPAFPAVAVNAISALHEVGQKVKRTVQYRTDIRSSTHLGVTVEVMFGGEKVGEGIGRTRKEAKYNAAESALLYLANKANGGATTAPSTTVVPEPVKEVRISRGPRDPRLSAGLTPLPRDRDDDSPIASTSGHIPLGVYHSNEEPLPYNHVEALKELCTREAINIQFKALPGTGQQRQAFRCQVEVGGRMLGRGSGPTWNEAKQEAAKEAYVQVESSLRPHKRGNGPRSPGSSKRMRTLDSFKDRGVPSSLSPVRGSRSRLSPRRQARNLSPIP